MTSRSVSASNRPGRHHRDRGRFARLDVGLVDDRGVPADHAQRELPVGFGDDVAGERAAVARRDDHHPVGVRDLAVRIEDVEEQVVQVGPVRAGDVGTDRAALAVHLVAGAAGPLEDATAVADVGPAIAVSVRSPR